MERGKIVIIVEKKNIISALENQKNNGPLLLRDLARSFTYIRSAIQSN